MGCRGSKTPETSKPTEEQAAEPLIPKDSAKEPEQASYKAETVRAAWDNHFGAFGAKDVAKIMLDYTEESVLRAFDHRTGKLDSCKGMAEIQKFFEGLFATLKDTSDLVAPTIDVTDNPKQVYLIWSCGASGIVSATDSFLFNADNKICRQNIAFTSKDAATSNATETPKETDGTAAQDPNAATSKATETPTETEGAKTQDPNEKKPAIDEDNVVEEIPTVEVTEVTVATEQEPASPEPTVEAVAANEPIPADLPPGQSRRLQDLEKEGASVDQAQVEVRNIVAEAEVVTNPVASVEQRGCCSRFCAATEAQSESECRRGELEGVRVEEDNEF